MLRKFVFLFYIFPVLLLSTNIIAQPIAINNQSAPPKALSQYVIDIWRNIEGLPNNAITSMLQTKDMFIWFGTYDGLVKFDGVNFITYNSYNTPEISSNNILTLFESSDGTLWIGSAEGGLVSYRNAAFKRYDEFFDNKLFSVNAITEDSLHNMWLGTDRGLMMLGEHSAMFDSIVSKLHDHYITDLLLDRQNRLWVGTKQEGLFCFTDKNHRHFPLIDVKVIHEDPEGIISVGLGNGLRVFRQGKFSTVRLSGNEKVNEFPITDMLSTEDGSLWIATRKGVFRFSGHDSVFFTTHMGLSYNDVRALLEDDEGNIWIGTYRAGVNRLYNGNVTTYAALEGIRAKLIYSIIESADGAVWIAGYGALHKLKNGKLSYYGKQHGLNNRLLRTIAEDQRGNIWCGTYGNGLFRFDPIKNKVTGFFSKEDGLSSNIIRALAAQGDTLWIGTRKGLNILVNGSFRQVLNCEVNGLTYIAEAGTLWISSEGSGLFVFDGKEFQQFTVAHNISSNVVMCTLTDEEGDVWIGTNNGLNILRNGSIASLKGRGDFFDTGVFQLFNDDIGNIWFGTSAGIYAASLKVLKEYLFGTGKKPVIRHFTEDDGLENPSCTGPGQGVKVSSGQLWFPTLDGAAMVNPENIHLNLKEPPIYIESVRLDSLAVSPGINFEIASDVKRIEFDYTALSFIASKNIRFKYMLEGYDHTWIDAGTRRTAYYTSIPAGSYTFKVIAANSDGIWNTKGANFSFEKKAAFNETIWFNLIIVLIIFSIVFGFFRLRIIYLKNQRAQLEKIVASRTKDLEQLNATKDKFFSIISHDLRNPFITLLGYSEILTTEYDELDDDEKRDLLSKMEKATRKTFTLLDNLLQWSRSQRGNLKLKTEVLDLQEICEENINLMQPYASNKNIMLRNEIVTPMYAACDRNTITAVIRNIISNAIKFTFPNGKVTICAEERESDIKICISDDGIGIKEEFLHHLFTIDKQISTAGTQNEKGTGLGLILCKEFVEKNKGNIWVESQEGKGSIFSFTLPKPESSQHSAENNASA